jgi:hypothetical protein
MMRNPLIHLGIATGVLLLAAGAYGVAYAIVEKASAEAAALHVQLDAKSENANQLSVARNALQALGENEELTTKYFVSPDNIVLFLEELESAARALGADMEVASVSTEIGPRERIQVALKITGSFDAVMRTVGTIEYGQRDSQVRSLTIDTATTPTGKREWTATATLLFGTQTLQAADPKTSKP